MSNGKDDIKSAGVGWGSGVATPPFSCTTNDAILIMTRRDTV